MKATLIRHLPTRWNRESLLQGHRDIPIDEPDAALRTAIADNRAAICDPAPPAHVFSSPLRRARQTAELYGWPDATVDPLLIEFNFGDFEGLAKADLLAHTDNRWRDDPTDVVLGESVQELRQRVEQFFAQQPTRAEILVFGHGAWIRAAICVAEGRPMSELNQFVVENNRPYVVEY